eukprot:5993976-Prymnesium_polylepis.1
MGASSRITSPAAIARVAMHRRSPVAASWTMAKGTDCGGEPTPIFHGELRHVPHLGRQNNGSY